MVRAEAVCDFAATSARVSAGQIPPIGRRLGVGLDELHPGLVLPLADSAFGATRGDDEFPGDEVGEFGRRYVDDEFQTGRQRITHVIQGREGPGMVDHSHDGGGRDRRGIPGVGECDDGGVDVDEVPALHGAAAGHRNPRHGIGDMLIAAGEEAEAVFARQRHPTSGRSTGHVVAARLTTEVGRLVDGHRESALDEFVRSRQTGHPAAEDRHPPPSGRSRRYRPRRRNRDPRHRDRGSGEHGGRGRTGQESTA